MLACVLATCLKKEWNCEERGHYPLNPATLIMPLLPIADIFCCEVTYS